MAYANKLFIHLIAAMFSVWLLIIISTLIYETLHIEEHVRIKALIASKNFSNQYMQMSSSLMSKSMMRNSQESILKDTNFHLFNITDDKGNTFVNEVSNNYERIQKQIKKFKHEVTIDNFKNSKITLSHDHDNNIFYLDVKIPWKLSEDKIGKLHTFYEATEHVENIYSMWFQRMMQSIVVMVLFFIAGYPTVLLLNRDIVQKNKSLSKTNIDILNLLGSAIAKRDSDTNAHNFRVTLYALHLGEHLRLTKKDLKSLIKGSFLHDVGKIGISDTILLKPSKLTDDEFTIMKQHVQIGEEIILNSEQLNDAKDVVKYHHEKYDGTGYLHGLSGESIPLNARIFAIADVFDALTSKRPYKEPFSYEKAYEIMKQDSGSHFDPKLLDLFFQIVPNLYKEINSYIDVNGKLKSKLNEKILVYF